MQRVADAGHFCVGRVACFMRLFYPKKLLAFSVVNDMKLDGGIGRKS